MKEWQKEKKEHPWTTKKQAKRIAADHAKHRPPKGGNIATSATMAASRDFTGLYTGSIAIANQRKP
jgi:hypothetical protein